MTSLDGGAFAAATAQSGALASYSDLGFGNHSLVVQNSPGNTLTITGASLLGIEKGKEGYVWSLSLSAYSK